MIDDPRFRSLEFEQVNLRRADRDIAYEEFLRTPSMHCGVYFLQAGSADGQSPHEEDELYFVQSGRGKFSASGTDIEVQPGTVVYVRAHEEHRFHSITEDLSLLVVFSTHPRDASMDSGVLSEKSDRD